MLHVNPLGRNWGTLVNWDSLGKTYASIAISWTIILYAGVIWLYVHRDVQYLKMRNIPLAIVAVSFLHVYLVKILLAYTTNGHFLCSVEFWIMSIYLPFGIAFFQANLSQLLSISTQQRRLLSGGRSLMRDPRSKQWNLRGLLARWGSLTQLRKTYVCIAIGMLAQIAVTAAIYGTNRKLQGHWGKIAYAPGQAKCRKGLEWIPSAMWQLFFCCIYGPYLLYRVRHVRDTHFWRLQVICCVIFGFPGAPLWLSSVFSTKFKPVNKWWVPPLWLAPGIIVMQAVTIFFPIYEHYLNTRLSSQNLSLLGTTTGSDHEKWNSTTNSRTGTSTANDGPRHDNAEIYTLTALEKALADDPGPLLTFAATKDFTAESIIFLIAVRNFRIAARTESTTRAQLFSQAREIYIQSVSEETAEFPININCGVRAKLDAIFAATVNVGCGNDGGDRQPWESYDKVSPFANFSASNMPLSPVSMKPNSPGWPMNITNAENLGPLTPATSTSLSTAKSSGDEPHYPSEPCAVALSQSQEDLCGKSGVTEGREKMDGGKGFDEFVFEVAERSIKYLVVTNTWRKFVTESRGQMGTSQDSLA